MVKAIAAVDETINCAIEVITLLQRVVLVVLDDDDFLFVFDL